MKITRERIIETRPAPHQWVNAYRVFHNNNNPERSRISHYLGENECGIHFVVEFLSRDSRCEAVLTPERRDSKGKMVEERFLHLRSTRWMPGRIGRRADASGLHRKISKNKSYQQKE